MVMHVKYFSTLFLCIGYVDVINRVVKENIIVSLV